MRARKLIALLILAAIPAFSFEFQAAWKDAEASYKNGDYLKAAEIYQKAAETDPSGWAASYNAGNALYKSGRLPETLEQYWKAYFANPRNPDLTHNLKMALRLADDSLAPQGIPEGLYRVWSFLNTKEWILLTILIWWVCAALLWKKKYSKWAWTSVFLCALSLSMAFSHAYAGVKKWGVFKTPGLLRSGPSASLPVTVQIPEGRFFWVVEEKEGWTLIETRKDALRGWIR